MVDQATVDAEWADRDIKERLASLEAFVGGLREAGLDRLIESGIIQFDGIDMRLDNDGMKFTAEDSGDGFPSVPNAASIRWFRDTFAGDPIGEVAGGYSTPTTVDASTVALRAFIDTFDASNAKVGVYDIANDRWSTLLAIQDGLGLQPMILADWIGSALTNILLVGRTDDDNYTLSIRKNGALAEVGGAMKVSGSGYLVYPSAAAGIDPANSGSAWTSGSYSEVVASTAQANYIVGMAFTVQATNAGVIEGEIDIATGGAGAETVVSTYPWAVDMVDSSGFGFNVTFPHAIAIATTTRIAVRQRSSSTTIEAHNVKLIYVKQSELVAL